MNMIESIKILVKELSKRVGIKDINEYSLQNGYYIDTAKTQKQIDYRKKLIQKHCENLTDGDIELHLAAIWKFINEV
jgi:hypothetical protein